MVGAHQPNFLSGIVHWLDGEPTVRAVVLFGSRARRGSDPGAADGWSDFDLQVVTTDPARLLSADWRGLNAGRLCLQVLRPATSGVRKLTLLYAEGEIDLVIVPAWQLRFARWALVTGWHRHFPRVDEALNNLSTIMGGGYRILKGERAWASFYSRVVRDMPGYRLDNAAVCALADAFVCDLHWVLQKLQRGEFVAAQRILHRSLLETNIVLRHEARHRAGTPTFQQARRVEQLLPGEQLRTVQVSARLEGAELTAAAWQAWTGLQALMREVVPDWRLAPEAAELLAPWQQERDGGRPGTADAERA